MSLTILSKFVYSLSLSFCGIFKRPKWLQWQVFKKMIHPGMEKILTSVFLILFSHSLNDVVCFGVGAGANVLTELAVS